MSSAAASFKAIRPLAATSSTLAQGRLPQVATINRAVGDIKAAISAVPAGSPDPASLQATFWAIDQLGNTQFGKSGSLGVRFLGGGITPVGAGSYKCNIFASSAYAIGANLGWGTSVGIPTHSNRLFMYHYAPSADTWADANTGIANFSIDAAPHVGDIAGFANASGGEGHAGIYVGGGAHGLVIYAGPNFAKAQSMNYVMAAGDEYPLFRRYSR